MSDLSRNRPVLWGRGDSTNVQKVIWVCAELGLTPERRIVGGPHGGTDAPEFAALNPNRTVPVWQEGNFALWESQAILRHLARRSGTLYGRDVREAALVDQWLDWFATVLWPPVRLLFLQVWRDRTLTWEDGPARTAVAQTKAALAILGYRLEEAGRLVSQQLTIADIAIAIGLNRLEGMDGPVVPPPAVAAWFDGCRARPGFDLAIEAEPDMPGHRARRAAASA